ncbi:hypothetical protein SMICM17S_02476 [Streptomyces microflavus]
MADGTYPPGSRVPGIVELSAEFNIATSTAQKALAHLRTTGVVRARQRTHGASERAAAKEDCITACS